MNGVHDMGGMECFGPIELEKDELLFHNAWERRVLAMTLAMGATGTWTLEKSRFARESLPPAYYLSAGYYRIWLAALEELLIEYQLIDSAELELGKSLCTALPLKRVLRADAVQFVLAAGAPVNRPAQTPARFQVGDAVTVINQHSPAHTRSPNYIKGHVGVIHRIHGCHVFADANATDMGEDPQWLYNVTFAASELWGAARVQAGSVHVDCWEPYLE